VHPQRGGGTRGLPAGACGGARSARNHILRFSGPGVHHPGITGTSLGGSRRNRGPTRPAWLSQIWQFNEAWDEESGLQACYGKALHLRDFSIKGGRVDGGATCADEGGDQLPQQTR
jgi:hypothetical protein